MDSAPRDGTWILALFVDRPRVVRWREGKSTKRYEGGVTVWFWSDGYFRPGEPVAWAPLPEPLAVACPNLPGPRPKPRLIEQKRTVVLAPKPKRRVMVRETITVTRKWCAQCERNVTVNEAEWCASPFCKAKAEVA